jgi:hypothetical protein
VDGMMCIKIKNCETAGYVQGATNNNGNGNDNVEKK